MPEHNTRIVIVLATARRDVSDRELPAPRTGASAAAKDARSWCARLPLLSLDPYMRRPRMSELALLRAAFDLGTSH